MVIRVIVIVCTLENLHVTAGLPV
ncbi:hypothetical protein F383_29487 [Gossypium arboreum]|uniref:Uncharacterized protein n=1 Tax=Gossypium arboreum TaxID=29729 RepID=A0A0B0MVB4_GOSAR|nr:hypothetical protein F383_29487 [Gossypium arboreum]